MDFPEGNTIPDGIIKSDQSTNTSSEDTSASEQLYRFATRKALEKLLQGVPPEEVFKPPLGFYLTPDSFRIHLGNLKIIGKEEYVATPWTRAEKAMVETLHNACCNDVASFTRGNPSEFPHHNPSDPITERTITDFEERATVLYDQASIFLDDIRAEVRQYEYRNHHISLSDAIPTLLKVGDIISSEYYKDHADDAIVNSAGEVKSQLDATGTRLIRNFPRFILTIYQRDAAKLGLPDTPSYEVFSNIARSSVRILDFLAGQSIAHFNAYEERVIKATWTERENNTFTDVALIPDFYELHPRERRESPYVIMPRFHQTIEQGEFEKIVKQDEQARRETPNNKGLLETGCPAIGSLIPAFVEIITL